MSVYIYSTLSAPTTYVRYVELTKENAPILKDRAPVQMGPDGREMRVTIKGGANVARKDGALDTPKGVMTKISDADYAWLKEDYHFKQHVAYGHIFVGEKPVDANKVATNMTEKDGSAPKTPDDPEYNEQNDDGKGLKVSETSKGKQGKPGGR
jgi:hypothetical protein